MCMPPWCIHCRELEPIWETVAGELEGVVKVGKVSTWSDVDEHGTVTHTDKWRIFGHEIIQACRLMGQKRGS